MSHGAGQTPAAADPPLTPASRLGRNVLALTAVSFFTDVSSEMIYPLLPLFLTGTLGASATVLGAIEGAAESAASLLKLASGWWSDRVTRRKPFVVFGYVLATVARPLIALAQSASQVLAIRLTDRVGKGIRTSPRDALIADSVHPSVRGRAFGFHRAGDHAGAVIGPLIAFALLSGAAVSLRNVFWLAAIPGAIALLVLIIAVREVPRDPLPSPTSPAIDAGAGTLTATPPRELGASFWRYLFVVLLFTLGNCSDAFLLLRANQLGVPIALIPILWAMLHVVKSLSSTPSGALSDRIGRKPLIVSGWVLFAGVYVGMAYATAAWHAWALFAAYGVFFGLTEGTEKAFVADLVPAARRGTAYGWYHFAIGIAALPASLVFGMIWDRAGATAAFTVGASIAIAAAVGMLVLTTAPASVSRR